MKKTDYQYRKDMVLGIVVNEYIRTINPISSGYIAKEYFLDLSSATIRNILAELETDGLLTHPHTSAGRIPTQEGYRYYVDNLMSEIQLLENEKNRIKQEYEKERKDLEAIIETTSQEIADITHYTSIISIDGAPGKLFYRGTSYVVQYPDSPDIQAIRKILEALEQKERILAILNQTIEKKIKFYIGHEITCSDMQTCALAVSRYKTRGGDSGRLAVLGPTRMDYQRVVSALDYFSELIEEI